MNELYWLTRAGNINTFFVIMCITSLVLFGVFAMFQFFSWLECEASDKVTKWMKRFAICAFVSGLIATFIPTTKEMIMIYGIGGTIDYIKSNDTAKQIPDKCINALDKFIDEYVNDDNNEQKENKEE